MKDEDLLIEALGSTETADVVWSKVAKFAKVVKKAKDSKSVLSLSALVSVSQASHQKSRLVPVADKLHALVLRLVGPLLASSRHS
jgi:hypothetical protein